MPYTDAARGTKGLGRPGSERAFRAQGEVSLPTPAPGHHWVCIHNPDKGSPFISFIEVRDGAL